MNCTTYLVKMLMGIHSCMIREQKVFCHLSQTIQLNVSVKTTISAFIKTTGLQQIEMWLFVKIIALMSKKSTRKAQGDLPGASDKLSALYMQ